MVVLEMQEIQVLVDLLEMQEIEVLVEMLEMQEVQEMPEQEEMGEAEDRVDKMLLLVLEVLQEILVGALAVVAKS
jgi:hypothetical protein